MSYEHLTDIEKVELAYKILGSIINNKSTKETTEKEQEEVDRLISYWNATLTIPKNLEKEFIEELFTRFGFDKTKLLIRQFAEGGFRKVTTMRESLNPGGTIKPKENYGITQKRSRKNYVDPREAAEELASAYHKS